MVTRDRFAAAWLVQNTRLLVLTGVAAVAITAGVFAGCRGLVVFGLANLVELIPSSLFAWRLQAEEAGKEVDFAGRQRAWHRIASLAFLSVTAFAAWMTLHQFERRAHEKAAVMGVAGAVLAVVLVSLLTVLRSRSIGPAMSLTNADDGRRHPRVSHAEHLSRLRFRRARLHRRDVGRWAGIGYRWYAHPTASNHDVEPGLIG